MTDQTAPSTQGRYALVNGLELYYEIHGSGEPLILLHGGMGAIEMFGELLPQLAAGRQVIGVDMQAHGRTADIDRPLRFEHMADDVAALIRELGLPQADVMGYSMGGGVALRTAIQHPALVRKLVLVSTLFKRSGWYPEVAAATVHLGPEAAEPMKQSPTYQLYASIAPRLEDWPLLLTKLGDLVRQEFDWTDEAARLTMPTLIVAGDADSFSPRHAVELFELLGGGQRDGGWDGSGIPRSRLAILPGMTHYNSLESPALLPAVIPFLDAPARD